MQIDASNLKPGSVWRRKAKETDGWQRKQRAPCSPCRQPSSLESRGPVVSRDDGQRQTLRSTVQMKAGARAGLPDGYGNALICCLILVDQIARDLEPLGPVMVDSLPLELVKRVRDAMRLRRLLVMAAGLLIAACAQDSALLKRADRLRAYQSAVRWGHFDQAAAFQDGVSPPRRATDKLRDIRVTDYEITRRREAQDRQSLQQTVTIRYYHIGEGVERTLIDEQDWRYDAARDDWVVDAAVPPFE